MPTSKALLKAVKSVQSGCSAENTASKHSFFQFRIYFINATLICCIWETWHTAHFLFYPVLLKQSVICEFTLEVRNIHSKDPVGRIVWQSA